jgi:hypothetical protein
MDWNNKKADALIGDVTLTLTAGDGTLKVEVPSRSPSPLRPYVTLRYEVMPQLFFESVEWERVAAQE